MQLIGYTRITIFEKDVSSNGTKKKYKKDKKKSWLISKLDLSKQVLSDMHSHHHYIKYFREITNKKKTKIAWINKPFVYWNKEMTKMRMSETMTRVIVDLLYSQDLIMVD